MSESNESNTPLLPKGSAKQRRKRKLPSVVHISGIPFKVRIVNLDRHQATGLSCHYSRWIKVHNELTIAEQESTLLHEILHMIIRLNLGVEFLPKDKEEILVSQLETALSILYQRKGKR